MAVWIWGKLSAVKWLDAWEERFRGNPNLVINLLKGGKSIRVEVYCQSREEAENIRGHFGGRVRELTNSDWQKPSRVAPPLKIRDRFVVTQEDEPENLKKLAGQYPRRDILSIPPEMAFGTGDHATTATCLRFLTDIGRSRKPGWSCADLGCGSGLLAIAAHKLGAGEVFACDYDPAAVQVAKRNVRRNHAGAIEVTELDVLKFPPSHRFDVILANLFSDVLIEAMPVIARLLARGGDLVVSGILADQAWQVFEAAAAHGLGFPKVARRGKWVTARGGWMADLHGPEEKDQAV